jgi:glycosyltransferase involved in cell wall biosynthesis
VRVLSLPVNLGIGGAVQAGLLYAERGGYDAAIQVDGDGQHEPTSARALLAVVLGGAADLCIGSRFLGDKSYPVPFARRTGIRYFSTLVRFLVGERASDPTSGFRAYGRRAIRAFAESYPADYPEPVSIISAARAGLVLAERPCRMHPRRHGQSSITPLRSLFYVVNVSLAMLIARSRRG